MALCIFRIIRLPCKRPLPLFRIDKARKNFSAAKRGTIRRFFDIALCRIFQNTRNWRLFDPPRVFVHRAQMFSNVRSKACLSCHAANFFASFAG